jgi:hypothetical protein
MLELVAAFKQFLLRAMAPRPPRPRPVPPPSPIILPTGESERSKSELFFEVMMRRWEAQSRASDAIAQKTATWLTVPSLVLTFLATILVVERDALGYVDYAFIFLGFVLYLYSLLALFRAYQPRDWRDGPYWEEIGRDTQDARRSVDDMHYSIAYHLGEKTLVDNDDILKNQKTLLTRGVIAGLSSVIILVGVVLFNLTARPAEKTANTPVASPTLVTPTHEPGP